MSKYKHKSSAGENIINKLIEKLKHEVEEREITIDLVFMCHMPLFYFTRYCTNILVYKLNDKNLHRLKQSLGISNNITKS